MASDGQKTRVRITHLVNCLGLGGTERQLVEQLRAVDRTQFAPDLCVLQKVGELLAPVRALGIEPEEYSLRGTLMQPHTVALIVQLAARMRRRRSQLLHTHDFYSNLVGVAAARLAGIPCLVSRRDLGAWIGPRRAKALTVATRAATHVLCNAEAIRQQLLDKENLPAHRITVVPNGLDLARFDAVAAKPCDPPLQLPRGQGPIFVMVGNMKHDLKGHAPLLHAMAKVRIALPQAHLVLVGDGALRTSLEASAQSLGIADSVTFAGRRDDVPAVLLQCHIGLSLSRSEGLSNSIMEMMAAHLPVIATAVGGTPELVRNGRSGLLVPDGEPEAWAARMVEMGRAPVMARQMGEAGRKNIAGSYTTRCMADRIESLYRHMTGNRREVRHAA